ncbi:MAG TPA: hypothetical protein VGS41_18475 [Chthonomonadales bacterium]|nr:hypothetical protein [Chthonomonadales bacterium]
MRTTWTTGVVGTRSYYGGSRRTYRTYDLLRPIGCAGHSSPAALPQLAMQQGTMIRSYVRVLYPLPFSSLGR